MSYFHLWNVKDISTYYWYIMYACAHIYQYLMQENIFYISNDLQGLQLTHSRPASYICPLVILLQILPLVVITPDHEY